VELFHLVFGAIPGPPRCHHDVGHCGPASPATWEWFSIGARRGWAQPPECHSRKKNKTALFQGFFSLGKGGANLDFGTKTEEGKVFGLIFFVQVAKLNWGQELRGSCDGGSCGKNMPQEFLTPGHPVIPPEVFSVFEYVWFLGGPNTTPPQEVVFGCLG